MLSMPCRSLSLIAPVALLILLPVAARAHGAHAAAEVADAVVVHFDGGHGGDAPAWRCTVIAPDGASVWTEGNTDHDGRFAFVPDQPGTWTVRGFGADGHGAEVTVEVDEAMLARLHDVADDHDHDHAETDAHVQAGAADHDHAAAAFAWPTWAKLVTGLSCLFGVFGVASLVRGRQG